MASDAGHPDPSPAGPADKASGQGLPRYRRIGRREGFGFKPGTGKSGYGIPGAKVYSNGWFVAYVRDNPAGVTRLGVVVSKRVAPRAVSRNLAKRLVREGFRRAFPAGCSMDGVSVDIIVRVRKQLDRNSASAGAASLALLLQGIRAKCGI